MFESVTLDGGGTAWRSSLLDKRGVQHLFTTRAWDVKSAEQVGAIVEAAGWFDDGTPPRVVMSKQVHRNAVSTPERPLAEADAHVTDDPAEVVAVRTADCVPVLLASADGQAVAAVHAGWRGLNPAVNVIGNAIAVMRGVVGSHTAVDEWVAALGPCISAAQYEVGEEVAALFRPDHPDAVQDDLGDKPHLDTRAVAVEQLCTAGLSREAIDVFPGCTFDDQTFHSYRRHGPGVGHLAAMINPRPPGA